MFISLIRRVAAGWQSLALRLSWPPFAPSLSHSIFFLAGTLTVPVEFKRHPPTQYVLIPWESRRMLGSAALLQRDPNLKFVALLPLPVSGRASEASSRDLPGEGQDQEPAKEALLRLRGVATDEGKLYCRAKIESFQLWTYQGRELQVYLRLPKSALGLQQWQFFLNHREAKLGSSLEPWPACEETKRALIYETD